jgi:ferrous iron transport protein A
VTRATSTPVLPDSAFQNDRTLKIRRKSMERIVSLAKLASQEKGTVQSLSGGRSFVGRMASLGFTPGADVVMVQNFGRGPLIVLVRGSRIALGRGEAAKVLVNREENGRDPGKD